MVIDRSPLVTSVLMAIEHSDGKVVEPGEKLLFINNFQAGTVTSSTTGQDFLLFKVHGRLGADGLGTSINLVFPAGSLDIVEAAVEQMRKVHRGL